MAASTTFPQSREPALVDGSTKFATYIAANYASIGLSQSQCTAFGVLNDAWVSAYQTATTAATRTKPALVAKSIAKKQMLASARQLIGMVQKYWGTSDVERAAMEINIPAARTPVPIPDKSPTITIKRVEGNVLTIDVAVPGAATKGKTKGIGAVVLYSYVGLTPDPNPANWHAEGSTSRFRDVKVAFPLDAEPFSKVWITGQFANPRGQCGVASTPVSTNLGTWMVQAVEAEQPQTTSSRLKAA